MKAFEAGTLILSQSKRSPLNLDFMPFYQDRISKLGLKIKGNFQDKDSKDAQYWMSQKDPSEQSNENENLSIRQQRIRKFSISKSR
jgi:hypothetical protein